MWEPGCRRQGYRSRRKAKEVEAKILGLQLSTREANVSEDNAIEIDRGVTVELTAHKLLQVTKGLAFNTQVDARSGGPSIQALREYLLGCFAHDSNKGRAALHVVRSASTANQIHRARYIIHWNRILHSNGRQRSKHRSK